MDILLSENNSKQNLYPFTQTRHTADIRTGILTIREKWEYNGYFTIHTGEGSTTISNSNPGSLSFNASLIPTAEWLNALKDSIINNTSQPDPALEIYDTKTLTSPVQIFEFNEWAIRKDFELITAGRQSQPISPTNSVINEDQVFIEEGASVEYSIINASTGPVYIGRDAIIMEGCMIRGPFALCNGATLKMGTKVYGGTTIGPYCKVAGELKSAMLFGYSNKPHDGYLGASVIGEWCNLGAGTTNSNVKNNAGEILLWNQPEKRYIPAGRKIGLLMGDYSRSAINTSFNTGTVVGICCNIYGEGFPPKYIPDFTWGKIPYELPKVMQDIDNWKKLKGLDITEEEIQLLTDLYNNKLL